MFIRFIDQFLSFRVFSKILEKLMYKRIIGYIRKNKILTDCQYGFRDNSSTTYAVIELVDKITPTCPIDEIR